MFWYPKKAPIMMMWSGSMARTGCRALAEGSPRFAPRPNTGAINLGAGLSFVVIYAAQTSFASSEVPAGGYVAALIIGAVVLVGALVFSMFIPKPVSAELAR